MGGVFRSFGSVFRAAAPVVGAIAGGPVGAAIGGAVAGGLSNGPRLKNMVIGAATAGIGSSVGNSIANSIGGSAIGSKVLSSIGPTADAVLSRAGSAVGTVLANKSVTKIAEGFAHPNPPPSQAIPHVSFEELKNNAVRQTANEFTNAGIMNYRVSSEDVSQRYIVTNMRHKKLSEYVNIYNMHRYPTIKASQKRRR